MEPFVRFLDSRRGLLVCTLALLSLHAIFLRLWPPVPLISDALEYHAGALSLLDGRGYLDPRGAIQTRFTPAYPLLLSGAYALLGRGPDTARFLNALLICGAAALVQRTARRLFSPRAAALGYLLFATLPATFVYTGVLIAECFTMLLCALYLFVIARPLPRSAGGMDAWSVVCGAVCGLFALTKPETLVWVLAPALWALGQGLPLRRAGRVLLLCALTAGAALSPWAARNARAIGHPLISSTAAGRTLWLAAHRPELYDYAGTEYRAALAGCRAQQSPADDLLTDQCLRRQATAMIRQHPGYYARTCAARLVRLLIGSHTDYLRGYDLSFGQALRARDDAALAVKGGLLLWHGAFVALGLLGLLALGRAGGTRYMFLHFMVITKVLVHVLVFATPRYMLHLAPVLAIAAGYWLDRRMRGHT